MGGKNNYIIYRIRPWKSLIEIINFGATKQVNRIIHLKKEGRLSKLNALWLFSIFGGTTLL